MSRYRHVMFDCETLSLRPRALVLSIGAVAFDEANGVHPTPFYVVLNRNEQKTMGREINAATVAWWNGVDSEARDVLVQSEVGMNLMPAIRLLFGWIRERTVAPDAWCAWSNGAEFDLPLLTDLLMDAGTMPPWHYRKARCMRTLKEELPEAYERALARHEQGRGEPIHHAGLDALWQATVTRDLLRELAAMRALTEALCSYDLSPDVRETRMTSATAGILLARQGMPR